MKHPFLLIEDADPDPSLSDAIRTLNPEWELQFRKITNADDYNQVISMLTAIQAGDLTAAFDLDYSNKAGKKTKTPYWDAMDAASKAVIPAQTKHGVNALLCLLSNFNHGNCLLVVSSNFTGDKMDSGRALRTEIQKIADKKRPNAVIHAFLPGGPLTVGAPLLSERLQEIKSAWDGFFGSMASRLTSSQNAGWFNDNGVPEPGHMLHSVEANDLKNNGTAIKNELAPWLASISGADASVIQSLLLSLFNDDGSGFYNFALRNVTGACALHCGRSGGKPLNMHGLALIACCYGGDFSKVFGNVTWLSRDGWVNLLSTADTKIGEGLLYLLVGKPSEKKDAPPSGVFGILGIHDGREGGTKGSKTVTAVELEVSSVKITFGVKGTGLVGKLDKGPATGDAYIVLTALRELLATHHTTASFSGSDSEFVVTITKP